MLEGIIESMAEFYSKNLAREVMKGLTENALKGKTCGGTPPLGYDLDERKYYKINEFEAQAVKLIFQLFLEGKTYGEIISKLNTSGYRTNAIDYFSEIHSMRYCGMKSIKAYWFTTKHKAVTR